MKRYLCILLVILLLLGAVLPMAAAAAGFVTEPMVAAGLSHTVALRHDGTVWAWGHNWYGQLGDGTTIDRYTPVQVQNLSNVTAIAAGWVHTVALRSDGTVWTWGVNHWGQLGDGATIDRLTPGQVQNLSNIIAIAAGARHALALREDGTVWAWGWHANGQFGVDIVQVQNLSNVTAIAAGKGHSIALRDDGTVWAWGDNCCGQLGDGTRISRHIPVQARDISNITAIAGGWFHTVALQADGTVWTWGVDIDNELDYNPTQVQGLFGVIDVAAGWLYSAVLRDNGTVWMWGGGNHLGQLGDGTTTERHIPAQVQNLSNVTAIATGGQHTVALHNDGTVWTWGGNLAGQLGDGTSSSAESGEWVLNIRTTPVQVLGPGGVRHFSLTEPTPFAFFADVPQTHWAHDSIRFVYEQNLMQGTDQSTFAPNGTLTRAAVATILHRMADEPATPFAPTFSDVAADRWYSNAITWAAQNGIVSGVGDGRFVPNANITREQFATMLHRYAAFMDYDMSAPALGSHPDSDTISSWAEEAMGWAVYHGLITGTDIQGTLDPAGTATRAQCAVILQRFITAFA